MSGRALAAIKQKRGFSLVEVLIVIFVIGILAGIVTVYVYGSRERSYFTRASSEFTTIENALKLYIAKYNDYPADVVWGLPAGITEFIARDAQGQILVSGPYPGSVYDYENWLVDDGTGNMVATRQISLRFCPNGGPLTACEFPNEDWAQGFGINSALYYCIEGLCRPHSSELPTYPGYCVNCPNNQAIGT